MSALKVGSMVNDYRVAKILGKNPLGATYLAYKDLYNPTTSESMIQKYILKTINLSRVAETGINPETLEKEVKVLTEVSANPICTNYMSCYYDYFIQNVVISGSERLNSMGQEVLQTDQYLVVVTDYINGPTLQEILLNQVPEGNFPMPKLIQMMSEIAKAVEYIHSYNIVHQNIKPSNIIYDQSLQKLKLIDFALSCSKDLNAQCKGKAGTTYYMPPELLASETDPSQKNFAYRAAHDVWSMGVVFYQLANPGQDYMNFNNNNPEFIAKEIQIGKVRESKYPYTPINSIIATILNKNPVERPTSSQVVILIDQGRPLCVINDVPFDRELSEAVVDSLQLDISTHADDQTLCKVLTDHLKTCDIQQHKYQKQELEQLAKLLGVELDENLESTEMCSIMQQAITNHQEKYSTRVTQSILRSIKYITILKHKIAAGGSDGLKKVLEKLYQQYNTTMAEAKKLQLINLKMLEHSRIDATRKSLIYSQNASVEYSKVYADIAKAIAKTIAIINPGASIKGTNIVSYQKKLT